VTKHSLQTTIINTIANASTVTCSNC